MRKLYLLALTALVALVGLRAQNVQLHYDFGRSLYSTDEPQRPRLTTTVELFRPDSWGSTWEISREFSLGKTPLSLHVEYNGGLSNQFSYKNAYLAGLTYAWNQADYSAGITFTPMYKYLARQDRPHSFQLTTTWYLHLAGGRVSFQGFADLWGDRHLVTGKNNLIFITEPQLWLNLNKFAGIYPKFNLSIGTEWEISSNFAVLDKTVVNPTLALKWTF